MESEIVAKGELLYATLFSVLLPRSPLFFIFYMELLNKGSTFIAFTSSLISLSSIICLLSSWLLGSSSILCILWFVLPWRVFSEHDFSIYLHFLDPTHTTSPRFSSWPSFHTPLLMMVAHCVCAAGTSESTYSDGIHCVISLPTPALWTDLQFCYWCHYFFQTFRLQTLELTLSSLSLLSFQSPSHMPSIHNIACIHRLLSSGLDSEVLDFWIRKQVVPLTPVTSVHPY